MQRIPSRLGIDPLNVTSANFVFRPKIVTFDTYLEVASYPTEAPARTSRSNLADKFDFDLICTYS